MLICNERCRRTQEREPAHTGLWLAIQRYQISQDFEVGPRQNWFISRFRWRCSLWCSTDSCGQISFITFWIFVCISAYLWIQHRIFLTLLTLDNCRYQTHERNITKFYLLIPKHLMIKPTKLQIDILNLCTTFWHCKKISDYFWTRVYRWPCFDSTPLHPKRHKLRQWTGLACAILGITFRF